MDRRNFLKILGITSSTALISSCGVDKANEKIIPYVIPPEAEVYPGKALYINSTCMECSANCGVEIKVNEKVYHEERGLFATKLEGIAGHPINDGALCARGQAGLFGLYHPDRIKRPMIRDASGNFRVATWKEALALVADKLKSAGGEKVLLSRPVSGTLNQVIDDFCRKSGVQRVKDYEHFSHANLRKANQIVFGVDAVPRFTLNDADLLISFGADLFETFLSPVEFASQFADAKKAGLNWYHAEPHASLTGAQANHRLILKSGSEALVAAFLLNALRQQGALKKQLPAEIFNKMPDVSLERVSQVSGIEKRELTRMAAELAKAKNPLLIAGGVALAQKSGLETALWTALIQYATGATDKLVSFDNALETETVGNLNDFQSLLANLKAAKVAVLFLHQVNPTAPDFKEALAKAGTVVVLSDIMNEVARQADVILPLSHTYESWGDAEPRKGLRTVIQPAIDPQYDSLSSGDAFLQLTQTVNGGGEVKSYKDYLFAAWEKEFGREGVKEFLQKGFRETRVSAKRITLQTAAITRQLSRARYDVVKGAVLVLAPSARLADGRFKNNLLLNELPEPLTTVTYGDYLGISTREARKLGIGDGDELKIVAGGKEEVLPAKEMPLLPEGVYLLQQPSWNEGYKVDERSGEALWVVEEVKIQPTGKKQRLAVLAGSTDEDERGLLPHDEDHHHGHHEEGVKKSLYPDHEHETYRWGMAVDLESCIGCNACAAACYVENNVPIVGEEEHLLGREMSWMRIEPFYEENGEAEFVPMMCQHCDNAPCEPVCPVYAAYHNEEGLNVQVYNRCVGTRYCSNNCPYKVRRFNWFDHLLPEPLDKMYNPDVSVRGRGIMEKCTFCIQRIRAAKDHAKDEGRLVQDGEIVPACAQTCPTNAITFGNLKDTKSKVYQLAHSDAAYRALEELGTNPAVHYLRKKERKHEA
ncbi:MAG: hypothetical protein Kow0037_15080 [Calditrichia bacterium]